MGNQACCSAADESAGQTTTVEPSKDKAVSEEQPAAAPEVGKIGFKLANGSVKYVTFKSSPLGMTFNKTSPVSVKRILPSSNAESLGIETGWIVAEVGGQSTLTCSMEETRNLLAKVASGLPKTEM